MIFFTIADYEITGNNKQDIALIIKNINKIIEKINKDDDEKKDNINCCFCETGKGALIRLYQGWCCPKCFKKVLLEK